MAKTSSSVHGTTLRGDFLGNFTASEAAGLVAMQPSATAALRTLDRVACSWRIVLSAWVPCFDLTKACTCVGRS